MNPFITDKVNQKSPFKKPSLYFCALMAVACLAVFPDFVSEGKWASALLELVFAFLFSLPIVRELRAMRDREYARKIASYLNGVILQNIDMDTIEEKISIAEPVKKIAKYIDKGYLTNISLDWEHKLVVLTAGNRLVEKERYVEVRCNSCGASKLMVRGRIAKCDYCGSPLVGKETEDSV